MNNWITDVFSHNPTCSSGLHDPGLKQEMTHGYGIKDPWSVVSELFDSNHFGGLEWGRRGARDLVGCDTGTFWSEAALPGSQLRTTILSCEVGCW